MVRGWDIHLLVGNVLRASSRYPYEDTIRDCAVSTTLSQENLNHRQHLVAVVSPQLAILGITQHGLSII